MPVGDDINIVADADKFMKKLKERNAKTYSEDISNNLPSTTLFTKHMNKFAVMYEDTVSDEEGSSSDEAEK